MSEDNVKNNNMADVIPIRPVVEPEKSVYDLLPELAPFFALINKLRFRCASLAYSEEFIHWLKLEDPQAGYVGNIHTSDTICVIQLARELMIIGMAMAQLRQQSDVVAERCVTDITNVAKAISTVAESCSKLESRIRRLESKAGIKTIAIKKVDPPVVPATPIPTPEVSE